jgi:hypothetical protein
MTDFNVSAGSQTDNANELNDNEEEKSSIDALKPSENEQYNNELQLPFGKLDLIRALYC